MRQIGEWIVEVLRAPADENITARVAARVTELCYAFPLYAEYRQEHAHSRA